MLRRLHPEQPDSFEFTPANKAWAEGQIRKYPEGRQASAVIPLLWRAQEQEGWVTRPAIEYVADMLGMAHIRVLEVASFYFMFQLQPVGSVAHIQVCGTTSCMICGAEALIAVCKEVIAPNPHELSADGRFSWEEVECLGACTNAPMIQVGKDFYEDLTPDSFREILEGLERGEVPVPGPQNGRFAAEPLGGPTTLEEFANGDHAQNASVARALEYGDTIKRIDGTEVPILTGAALKRAANEKAAKKVEAEKPAKKAAKKAAKSVDKPEGPKKGADKPVAPKSDGPTPELLDAPRGGGADDLKKITGIGPKLEEELNKAGIWHYDQIAQWSDEEVAWADENLVRFKGRVTRDDWRAQARALVKAD
ncbi:NADH-quinone oxidoreductase subunit E [Oceanomicrobium pacificus]|uniref:NADH-quinone oxidoreductase subunit E n=1 Tax=Oceanomicrobium pacificus TaxID=2692916 RepID=A0A6B0TM15_9RHOB|nr:NADH-quinone oxidoreductase subunit E [Oceanomicrobium pacificus]MXU65600.1 NADH-quinone oxidoreductase subunit E [Oceanomicrobium pacificus]